jgi:agmatinase
VTASRNRPADPLVYPRFEGIRSFMRLPHARDLEGVDVAVVGVPFDTTTTFRPGARFGPEAIRAMSALLRPYHGGHGVDVFEHLSVVDWGDVAIVPGNTERSLARIEEELGPLVAGGVLPLVLGGDHAITLGELRALAQRHGPLAVVQFDSHSDTGDTFFGERYSHGTTFRRAAEEGIVATESSLQAGIRGSLYGAAQLPEAEGLGFRVVTAEELRELGPARFGDAVRTLAGERPVFVSFDIDFADPAFAPATGTPEVGGFSSAEVVAYLRGLTGVEIVGFDCVEVAPAYDGPGQATALLAANVTWEVLALAAVRRAEQAEGSEGT